MDDNQYHEAVHQLLQRRNTSEFLNSESLSRRTQHNHSKTNNNNTSSTSTCRDNGNDTLRNSKRKSRTALMLSQSDDDDHGHDDDHNDHHDGYEANQSDLPSMDTLSLLHRRLKASQANLLQKEQAWHELVDSSRKYQAMVDRDYSYLLIPQVRLAHKYPISPWEMIHPPGGDNPVHI
jgi:hypothetical protein